MANAKTMLERKKSNQATTVLYSLTHHYNKNLGALNIPYLLRWGKCI